MAYEPVPPSPEDRTVDVDGIPVHYIDHGGSGPIVVLVHGLGGAAINWMAAAPILAARTRVVALDLAGFGNTPSLGRPPTMEANARLVVDFVTRLFAGPVILVGNSMGGTVTMLAAAAHPDRVAGTVLVDPALPVWPDALDPVIGQMFLAYATPGVGEALLAQWAQLLGPEDAVEQLLLLCFADPTRLTPQMRQAHVDLQIEMAERQDQEIADFLEASRSMTGLLMDIDRWRDTVVRIQAPTLLVAGELDRLVPLVASQSMASLRPDWAFRVMPGVGHTPMMEDPAGFADVVFDWLDGEGKGAVRAAEHEEILRPLA